VTGRATAVAPVPADVLERDRLESALASLRGTYLQEPPSFSAKKIGGVRAYALARHSVAIAPEPVSVTVDALELISVEGDTLHLRMTVSAGFYVRALAHSLGATLGVGGCIVSLRRTRSGDFRDDEALRLDEIERDPGNATARIVPLDALLPDLPAVQLSSEGCRRALHGAAIRPGDAAGWLAAPDAPGLVRLLGPAGELVAVARHEFAGDVLHPTVVVG
jgi:tRNA pseudouridine55 synthase